MSKYADISNAFRLPLQGDELFWSHDRHVGIEGTPRAKGECRGLRMLCTESKNRCVRVFKRSMSQLAKAFRRQPARWLLCPYFSAHLPCRALIFSTHSTTPCTLIYLRTYPAVTLFRFTLTLTLLCAYFSTHLPCCDLTGTRIPLSLTLTLLCTSQMIPKLRKHAYSGMFTEQDAESDIWQMTFGIHARIGCYATTFVSAVFGEDSGRHWKIRGLTSSLAHQ